MHGKFWEILRIYERGMGAPVFALMGYAAASHGIPRGFACRWVVGRGRKFTVGVVIAHRRPNHPIS